MPEYLIIKWYGILYVSVHIFLVKQHNYNINVIIIDNDPIGDETSVNCIVFNLNIKLKDPSCARSPSIILFSFYFDYSFTVVIIITNIISVITVKTWASNYNYFIM